MIGVPVRVMHPHRSERWRASRPASTPRAEVSLQTFLPLSDFAASARALDRQRLGKQRVEAWMLFDVLTNPDSRWRRWRHHPVVAMWRGYEDALCLYFWTMVDEWRRRGYRNTITLPRPTSGVALPPWLGDERVHASHRSNLLRKKPEWYGRFGWSEGPDQPYCWPGRDI
jgi:hypothetical protein